jgi:hypothetical protein
VKWGKLLRTKGRKTSTKLAGKFLRTLVIEIHDFQSQVTKFENKAAIAPCITLELNAANPQFISASARNFCTWPLDIRMNKPHLMICFELSKIPKYPIPPEMPGSLVWRKQHGLLQLPGRHQARLLGSAFR